MSKQDCAGTCESVSMQERAQALTQAGAAIAALSPPAPPQASARDLPENAQGTCRTPNPLHSVPEPLWQ